MRFSILCPTVYVPSRIHLLQALGVYCYESYLSLWRYEKSRNGQKQNNSLRRSRTRRRIQVSSTWVSIMFVTYIVFKRRPSCSCLSVFTFHTINTIVVEYYRCKRQCIYHNSRSRERETISFRIVFVLVRTFK